MAQRQRRKPEQRLHRTSTQQQQGRTVARGRKALRRFPDFDEVRREELLDRYEEEARAEEHDTEPEEEEIASEEDVLFLTEGGDEAEALFEQTLQDEGEGAVPEPEELFRETPEFFAAGLHPLWIHFRGKLLWGASARTIGRMLRSRLEELERLRRGLEKLLASLDERVHPLFADASPADCRGLLQASWFLKGEKASEKNQAPALLEKIKDLAIWDLDHPERPFLPLGELFVRQGRGGDKTHLELRWLREELRNRDMRLEDELAPGRRFWLRNKTWLPEAYNNFFFRLGEVLKNAFELEKNPFYAVTESTLKKRKRNKAADHEESKIRLVTESTLKETRLHRWKEIFAALDTNMGEPKRGGLSGKGEDEEKSGRRGSAPRIGRRGRRKGTMEDAASATTKTSADDEGGTGA